MRGVRFLLQICVAIASDSRKIIAGVDTALVTAAAAHLIQFLCLLPPLLPSKYLLLGGPPEPSVASWLEFEGWMAERNGVKSVTRLLLKRTSSSNNLFSTAAPVFHANF